MNQSLAGAVCKEGAAHRSGGPSLGIDLGATTIKGLLRSADGHERAYVRAHQGRLMEALTELLQAHGAERCQVALTGTGGRDFARRLGLPFVDPAVALLTGLAHTASTHDRGAYRHIIDIGASGSAVVDLDARGRFEGYRCHALCAAGTGSFLDAQAERLGIAAEDRCLAMERTDPPRIAARCAVFAKSDLIHQQQRGRRPEELWSGLCRSIVGSIISALFEGRPARGPALLVGGVALNREVVRWLGIELSVDVRVAAQPQMFLARGAGMASARLQRAVRIGAHPEVESQGPPARRPSLQVSRSVLPKGRRDDAEQRRGTTIRVHGAVRGDLALGLDVGSTSTKAVLTDLQGRPLADLYRRTAGDPVGAAQSLLRQISELAHEARRIRAVGVTGSGRRLVGAVLGADVLVDEITAHVTAVLRTEPDARHIIEIGGQDAKLMRVEHGRCTDARMNYLCAGGTGSFIEEQAARLGVDIEAVADLAEGVRAPITTDRCTVFMGQAVDRLLQDGFTPGEVLGAVIQSVASNYARWAFRGRPLEAGKVCFMGATAKNRALVAAFEQLLDRPIHVSPWCHVMGALGAAMAAVSRSEVRRRDSRFVGFEVADAPVRLQRESCDACFNHCTITRAHVAHRKGEQAPSWGRLCGREDGSRSRRALPGFDAFRKRERLWREAGTTPPNSPRGLRVGMPRALLAYSHLPFWSHLFVRLGVEVVLGPRTSDATRALASQHSSSRFCHPVQLAHGHVVEQLESNDIDLVFAPYLHRAEAHADGDSNSVFCPYVRAWGPCARMLASDLGMGERILAPAVDLQWTAPQAASHLLPSLARLLGAKRAAVEDAWAAAQRAQCRFEAQCAALGRQELRAVEACDRPALVLLGRAYNRCDPGLNLSIPQKLAALGFTVLPMDLLPLSEVPVDGRFANSYWRPGRRLIQAASFVARHPKLHAVVLTSHACGPDAFLVPYAKAIMGDKAMLTLELDGHDADVGYQTRMEAFAEVVRRRPRCRQPITAPPRVAGAPPVAGAASNPGRLWIPPMHPYGARLVAAAMRRRGRDARAMPAETNGSLALARAHCHGGECLPALCTVGGFLEVLTGAKLGERHSMFIPASGGPCRYGQYQTLHRHILDSAGFSDAGLEGMWDDDGRWFYDAAIVSDLLFKARCRRRPYDPDPAAFDSLMEALVEHTCGAIEEGVEPRVILAECLRRLLARPTRAERRPLVGVVGELYLRYNSFSNGGLIERVEAEGGEAWVEPLVPWFQFLAWEDAQRTRQRGAALEVHLKRAVKQLYMRHRDRQLTRVMLPILGDRPEPDLMDIVDAGAEVLPRQYYGEPIVTVGRAMLFARAGADLVVNVSPFHCMSGTLTASLFGRLGPKLTAPVLTLFCDGEWDATALVRTHLAVIDSMSPRPRRGTDRNGPEWKRALPGWVRMLA